MLAVDFDYDVWTERVGLSTDSSEKLKKANLVTENAIGGLLPEELLELKLPLGDRSLFRTEWTVLSEQHKAATRVTEHTGPLDVKGGTQAAEFTAPT